MMNLASWVILGVVVAALAFAVKATFFKKHGHGGCCGAGDRPRTDASDRPHTGASDAASIFDFDSACPAASDLICGESGCSSCDGCPGCAGSATARNALKPTVKPVG